MALLGEAGVAVVQRMRQGGGGVSSRGLVFFQLSGTAEARCAGDSAAGRAQAAAAHSRLPLRAFIDRQMRFYPRFSAGTDQPLQPQRGHCTVCLIKAATFFIILHASNFCAWSGLKLFDRFEPL